MHKLQILLFGIIAIILIIGIGSYFNGIETQKVQEHERYCQNWGMDLENLRLQLVNQTDYDPTQYNSELNDWKKECEY